MIILYMLYIKYSQGKKDLKLQTDRLITKQRKKLLAKLEDIAKISG